MPEMQLRLQVGLHFTFLHQSLPSWTGFLIHPQESIPLCQDTIPLNNNESGQFYHAASLNSNPEDRGHREPRWGWGPKKKKKPSRGQIQTGLAWQIQSSGSQHRRGVVCVHEWVGFMTMMQISDGTDLQNSCPTSGNKPR